MEEVLGSVRHSCVGGVAPETFTARRELTRDTFAKRLNEVLRIVNRQNEYDRFLEKQAQELKSDVIMTKKLSLICRKSHPSKGRTAFKSKNDCCEFS